MSDKKNPFLEAMDINQDGELTAEEVQINKEITELHLREEKSHAQKQMSWTALGSMIVFTVVLFSPIVAESRVAALADLLGLFYIGQASIVGFFFGCQAYMSRK